MSNHPPSTDDPANWPRLGRLLSWVDRPGSAHRLFWGLAMVCIVLVMLDFTYKKYGHFGVEAIPGAYGIYGYVMFTLLIFAAKILRDFIKRPENYYGDKAVDSETYPEDQLDRVQHGD
ncbi:MAG: hypothetical protein GKR99_00340 [Rhodobacteraceae bacterium]|nr:hypothetical protein [Paracoccaceae bacterium]